MPTTAVQTPSQCGGSEPTRPRPVFTEARLVCHKVTSAHLSSAAVPQLSATVPHPQHLPQFHIICHLPHQYRTTAPATVQQTCTYHRSTAATSTAPHASSTPTRRYLHSCRPAFCLGRDRAAGGRHTARAAGGRLTAHAAGGRHTARAAGGRLTARAVGGRLTARAVGGRHTARTHVV